jgi:signal transduction histidine kinase
MMPRRASPALTSVATGAPGMLFKFVSDDKGFGHFSYASDGAQKVLGLSPRALCTQPQRFIDLVMEDERPGLARTLAESAASLLEWNWEGRIRVPGWSDIKWVNLRASPRKLTDGRVVWDGLIQNISLGKRREATIQSSRDQIATLAAHQERAREDERLRLARELHDDVGGNLAGIKMQLAMLLGKLAPEIRQGVMADGEALNALVDRTIESTRRISANLRPPTLDLGLVAALEWFLDDFSQRTGIEVCFHAPEEDIELAEHRSIGVFRVCQEALNNVFKHSGARAASVSLSQDHGTLLLEVRDDGQGFEQGDPTRADAFGLRGMFERASALGATLEVHSAPGAGTTVRLAMGHAG